MTELYFRLDLDEGIDHGIGHFVRSLQLYRKISKKNCVFLVNNPKLFIKLIKKNLIKTPKKIIKYDFKNFTKTYYTKNKNIFVFDTLGRDKNLKKYLKSLNDRNKIISLEDKFFYNKYNDVIINSKVKLYNHTKKTKSTKIYSSIKYTILRFDTKNKYHKLIPKKIYKILVCSGGADYKKLLSKVSSMLVKFKNLQISCIVGPSVKKEHRIFKLSKMYPNLKLIVNKFNISNEFKKADLVISSGGSMMIESIFFSKPTFVIETFNHQKEIIQYFNSKKLIFSLGSIRKLSKKKIESLILNVDENLSYINKMTKKSFRLIDNKGVERVLKIISKNKLTA